MLTCSNQTILTTPLVFILLVVFAQQAWECPLLGLSSEFYFSHNSAEPKDAKRDCRQLFGGTGSPVSIDTPQKATSLAKAFRDSGDLPGVYWTSGHYNSTPQSNGTWVWGDGQSIEEGKRVRWIDGQPPTKGSFLYFVTVTYKSGDLWLDVQETTREERFICEAEDTRENKQSTKKRVSI